MFIGSVYDLNLNKQLKTVAALSETWNIRHLIHIAQYNRYTFPIVLTNVKRLQTKEQDMEKLKMLL